ncbi:hypothetical protein FKW77_003225 [Venturia effusa]|uniref:Uncharacterized protein n=1 Tax=Venturia effusa TaxID=50376 RepID=A0A517L127_9PEZI|nr:hypothetical protein FKW77_003225 [Venturia effusa]
MNAPVVHLSQKLSITYNLYAFLNNVASAKLPRSWIHESIMSLEITNHASTVPEIDGLDSIPRSTGDIAPPPYSELDASPPMRMESLPGQVTTDKTMVENASPVLPSTKPEKLSPTPSPANAAPSEPSVDTSSAKPSENSAKSSPVDLAAAEISPFSDSNPQASSEQNLKFLLDPSSIDAPPPESGEKISDDKSMEPSLDPLITSAEQVDAHALDTRDVSSKDFRDPLPGPLPIDVTMAALSAPMSPDRSPMRHVPSPIDTCMNSLKPTPREFLIDSPWPLTPLAPGTTAVESVPRLEGGTPFSPMDEVNAMTLDAVFRQLAVHRTYNLGVSKPSLPNRNPQRIQTNNQPRLSVRFDDMATPTTARPIHYSAVPFSPCTPQAMSFTAPWMVPPSPAIGEETAESCAIAELHKPAFDELTTPICRAYYFEPQRFAGRVDEKATPSTYGDDATLLALESDSQDSVILYDRVGERMTEVSTLEVPGWSKDRTERGSSVEQEALKTPSSAHIVVAPQPSD